MLVEVWRALAKYGLLFDDACHQIWCADRHGGHWKAMSTGLDLQLLHEGRTKSAKLAYCIYSRANTDEHIIKTSCCVRGLRQCFQGLALMLMREEWALLQESAEDWPGFEVTSGGLRAPAFSVGTPAPWLSAAPAAAFGCSPPRPSEWSPYSSACLWGRQKTKVHIQSQLTIWPADWSSKGFFMALKALKA